MRFVRMRRVEGCADYASPEPWLARLELTDVERMQLLRVVREFDPSLDDATIFGGPFSAFGNANGIAEVPLEWWDVEADDGRVVYQLWISCVDGAQLFAAGTTTSVAYVSAFAFWGDGWEGDSPGSLADQLDRAQAVVKATGVDTELGRIAFIARTPRP